MSGKVTTEGLKCSVDRKISESHGQIMAVSPWRNGQRVGLLVAMLSGYSEAVGSSPTGDARFYLICTTQIDCT